MILKKIDFTVQNPHKNPQPKGRDGTYDVTAKNAQERQFGTRRILTPHTLVYHLNK